MSRMEQRISLNWPEYDALSRTGRRRYAGLGRPGVCKLAKKQYRRRLRRKLRPVGGAMGGDEM